MDVMGSLILEFLKNIFIRRVDNMDKKRKKNHKAWILWIVIAILTLALIYQNTRPVQEGTGPELGKPGTEYFNQEPQKQNKENKEKSGEIGVSVPASLMVQNGKALISIKNTGQQAYVPYTLAEGREIYRASRVINPGEKISAVIPVGTAASCVTYVETLNGEKFSVTTKLLPQN